MILVTPEELQAYRDHYAVALSGANGAAASDGADNEDATTDAAIVTNVEEAIEAAFWIGYCYYFKTGGVERDHEESKRIWVEALELHDRHKERQRRQLCRGGENEDNKDVGARDKTGKLRYYLRYLEQGDRKEELLLESIPRLQWEASELNDRIAQHDLGFCYWLGYGGLEPDPVKEAHWYERSAQQGHPDAQHGIADCYEKGRGVKKDFVDAIYWYDRAIANQNIHAIRSRQEIIRGKIHPEVRPRVLACVQNRKFMEGVPRLKAAAIDAASKVPDAAATTPFSFMGLFLRAVQTFAVAADRECKYQVINNRISHNNMNLYTPIYWAIQAMVSLEYFVVPNQDKPAQEVCHKKQKVSSN